MFLPVDIAGKGNRTKEKSDGAESVWKKSGTLRKGEPIKRRQSHTPAESPESKRGDSLVTPTE
ncbi:MAG: hypothetical protein DRI90_01750 [Deltaproteobacteria bacterium]|nr:MAG: hypothetical protein DRI90_01750 [Deltaproteobacteria bacterium]